MRSLPAVLLALAPLAGCWKLDESSLALERLVFDPAAGAPEGWSVAAFETPLLCPDLQPARFYLVYPDEAAANRDAIQIPLAILFHSGAFDYIPAPVATDPVGAISYQEQRYVAEVASPGEEVLATADLHLNRLTLSWAVDRVFATLGMYPNYDLDEQHTGALPAALAEKGIATLLPANCWGDLWHNRIAVESNNVAADFFDRNGRTIAEFAWLHATTGFPEGAPVELPVRFDTERVALIGLGEGSRAVSELLSLREALPDGTAGAPLYQPSAAVLDSPADDTRAWYTDSPPGVEFIRSGLARIFPAGGGTLVRGALGATPRFQIPARIGLLVSDNDPLIPAGANDGALTQIAARDSDDAWLYRDAGLRHVLSNSDPEIAKAVADYVVGGLEAVPESLRSAPP